MVAGPRPLFWSQPPGTLAASPEWSKVALSELVALKALVAAATMAAMLSALKASS